MEMKTEVLDGATWKWRKCKLPETIVIMDFRLKGVGVMSSAIDGSNAIRS